MFWEPHTSSIDFCESNYLHSDYIVELHSVWSSFLGITLPGLIGYWMTLRASATKTASPLGEWRVKLSHLILAFTGLGSMGLHGTLHWFFQSSDELPMIYLVLANLYAIAEIDAPLGQPNYPWLGPAMVAITVLLTFIYYAFQELYWVFLLTFSSALSLFLLSVWRFLYGPNARQHGSEVWRITKTTSIRGFCDRVDDCSRNYCMKFA